MARSVCDKGGYLFLTFVNYDCHLGLMDVFKIEGAISMYSFPRNSILMTPLLWFTISHVINAGVELKFSRTHLPSVSPVCFSFALRGTEDVRPQ